MTKESFINSGRITDLKTFINLRPKENLHIDCTDVVLYEDGRYIQMLKTGEYLFDTMADKSLENVEEFMWNKLSEF
jgi:hypothetical protein